MRGLSIAFAAWLALATPGDGPVKLHAQQPGADVVRVPPNDSLTRQHLVHAAAASSTARELLSRVERLQDTVLILRAHPLLTREENLLGRGRFWVVRGHLYGLLEYQAEPVGSYRAIRIIAHELAHALEVGMADRGVDTESLRPLVVAREKAEDKGPVPGVETEFARAVGYRVQLEMLGRLTGPSALSEAADNSHLALGLAPVALLLPEWLGSFDALGRGAH
jgi:hypothetical protein